MGSRYEVYGWARYEKAHPQHEPGYHYLELYRGQSLTKALWFAFTGRRHYGCIKLKMR